MEYRQFKARGLKRAQIREILGCSDAVVGYLQGRVSLEDYLEERRRTRSIEKDLFDIEHHLAENPKAAELLEALPEV